jgi:hypothetical protein
MMAAKNAGFSIALNRVRDIQKGAALARQRAIGTLARRLNTESVRTISKDILNLRQNKVRPNIQVKSNSGSSPPYVTVSANSKRLPLTDYGARVGKDGATVTTWRDAGPQKLPHAFARKDDKPGIWQRIPAAGGGLVGRLLIVERKGPDIKRVFLPEGMAPLPIA